MLAATATRAPDAETHDDAESLRQATEPIGAHDDAPDETYEAVVLAGYRYLCSIPVVRSGEDANGTAVAEAEAAADGDHALDRKEVESQELMRATARGWELLESMRGSCIYYVSGWWSYSLCYGGEVRQFHPLPPGRGVPIYPPTEDTSVSGFVLGKFSADKSRAQIAPEGESDGAADDSADGHTNRGIEVAKLETKGATRYLVHRLVGGTECDLTGRDRRIEVQASRVLAYAPDGSLTRLYSSIATRRPPKESR